jgi:hypothetical protein
MTSSDAFVEARGLAELLQPEELAGRGAELLGVRDDVVALLQDAIDRVLRLLQRVEKLVDQAERESRDPAAGQAGGQALAELLRDLPEARREPRSMALRSFGESFGMI